MTVSYVRVASPASPTVHTPRSLLFVARDVTTSANGTCIRGSAARVHRGAVERRRSRRCGSRPAAARVHEAHDRADVVRHLRPIEHDQKRRAVRLVDQIATRSARRRTSATTLTDRPAGERLRARRGSTRRTATPRLRRAAGSPGAASIPARAHAQRRDAASLERLEHRVDPGLRPPIVNPARRRTPPRARRTTESAPHPRRPANGRPARWRERPGRARGLPSRRSARRMGGRVPVLL